jgi:hypothetical protein
MATTATVLAVSSARGRRGLPRAGGYRQWFRRELSRGAYGPIDRHAGAMTPGGTGEPVDARALAKIERLIDALRRAAYRWSPVWRTYVPKQKGQRRPLGLPTWSETLVPEAGRLLLEAYDAPQCSDSSPGLRHGRGCPTALQELPRRWRGVTWCIEGDKGCYDNSDQQVLGTRVAKDLHEKRVLRRLAHRLQAGSLAPWQDHTTRSGTPQGAMGTLLTKLRTSC